MYHLWKMTYDLKHMVKIVHRRYYLLQMTYDLKYRINMSPEANIEWNKSVERPSQILFAVNDVRSEIQDKHVTQGKY